MYTEAQKQQVYKNWIAKGRPWFNIDASKEPTYAERQIIIEMKQRETGIKQSKINEVKKFDGLIRHY